MPSAVSLQISQCSSHPFADRPEATDYTNGKSHIDIWTGSTNTNGSQGQISCEDNLTLGGRYAIVRDPPTYYGVNSKFLTVN